MPNRADVGRNDNRRPEGRGFRMLRLLGVAVVIAICALRSEGAFAGYACNDNRYVNSSGDIVHSPTCETEPGHHTAHCRDGSESFSEHHQGMCSHHGGVDHWDQQSPTHRAACACHRRGSSGLGLREWANPPSGVAVRHVERRAPLISPKPQGPDASTAMSGPPRPLCDAGRRLPARPDFFRS